MSLQILGMGTAVPPDSLNQEEGLTVARELSGGELRDAPWLATVYAHSGIERRHQVLGAPLINDLLHGTRTSGSVYLPNHEGEERGPTTAQRMTLYAEHAPRLAIAAATQALAEANVEAGRVTHLVTVSCTGFIAPGVDFALMQRLNIPATVQRTHVGFMGCHGALNGLRVANAFATADPSAVVLVCAVELCSLHYYYGMQPDRVVANALFADGAAAVVGTAGASNAPWQLVANGSCLIDNTDKAMAWTVGDHGFEMTLSRKIPDYIAKHLKTWLESWLSDNGLSLADVQNWAIHPGGPKILAAVQETLNLSDNAMSASRHIYSTHGNMSSPTVLFTLNELRQRGVTGPTVALGFGPGLVVEAALCR